uniref:Uncharacterized protein n=1 Tax=Methanococcus maripaludis (strain C6 / ATCC BAA-1332) TaxID=444158 RepID=A9A6E6_METM6
MAKVSDSLNIRKEGGYSTKTYSLTPKIIQNIKDLSKIQKMNDSEFLRHIIRRESDKKPLFIENKELKEFIKLQEKQHQEELAIKNRIIEELKTKLLEREIPDNSEIESDIKALIYWKNPEKWKNVPDSLKNQLRPKITKKCYEFIELLKNILKNTENEN